MVAVAKSEAPDVASSCGPGVNACWVTGYPKAQYGCECSDGTGVTLSSTSCTCTNKHAVDFVQVTTQVTYTPTINFLGIFPPITLNSQAKMRYALQ
jgi:hypothetical protein